MFALAGLALAVICVALIAFRRKEGTLHPAKLFPAFVMATNVPFLLYCQFDKEIMHFVVRDQIVANSYTLLPLFVLLMGLFLVFHGIGTGLALKSAPFKAYEFPPPINLLLYAIVVYLGARLIISIGGLLYWEQDVLKRTFVVSRSIFEQNFVAIIMWMTTLTLWKRFLNRGNIQNLLLVMAVFALSSFILSFTGSRKYVLWLVAIMGIYYTWHHDRIRIGPLIAAAASVTAYVLFVGVLRKVGISRFTLEGDYFSNPLRDMISVTSYTQTYLFIVDNFRGGGNWWGSQFLVIPYNLFGARLPADDGVLIRALAYGFNGTPIDVPNNVYLSSWPPETFGSGFANFHVFGTIAFGTILGIVHGTAYNVARNWHPVSFGAMLYSFVFLNFQLSNLRLIQSSIFIVMLLLVVAVAYLLGRPARTRRSVAPRRF